VKLHAGTTLIGCADGAPRRRRCDACAGPSRAFFCTSATSANVIGLRKGVNPVRRDEHA